MFQRLLAVFCVVSSILYFIFPSTSEALRRNINPSGYTAVDSQESDGPVFNFLDITSTGERVTFSDVDEGVASDISLSQLNGGAGFPFYGESKTVVHMSSNGFLHFELNGSSGSGTNECDFNSSDPNNLIAVLWDDLVMTNPPLDPGKGGYHQYFSICPIIFGSQQGCKVFEWSGAIHAGIGDQPFDFEAIMYESGDILFQYRSGNPENGQGSTTGLHSTSSNQNLKIACDEVDSIPDDYAVLFLAPREFSNNINEIEPNNEISDANSLALNQCGTANIDPGTDVDSWRVNAKTNDLLFAYVSTAQSNQSKNSYLAARSSNGVTIFADDEDSGSNYSSVISGSTIPSTIGNIFLDVAASSSELLPITPYTVYGVVASPADSANEIEPNNLPSDANTPRASVTNGESSNIQDPDLYSVPMNVGDELVVMIDNDPDKNSVNTSTLVDIILADGTLLDSSDEFASRPANAIGPVRAASATTYFVRVTGDGATTDSNYRVSIVKNCKTVCPDADGDDLCSRVDNCPDNANPDQIDRDSDLFGDSCDQCPTDPKKLTPGLCGCGFVDTDSDNDGFADCVESCSTDSAKIRPGICGCGVPDIDSDKDGKLNCEEECPEDPSKFSAGSCGCGTIDLDIDGNGVTDCLFGSELKEKLKILNTNVRALRKLNTGASPRKIKALRSKVKAVLRSLRQVITYGNANSTGIVLVNTIRTLSKILSDMEKTVKKATIIDSDTFERDKRSAHTAIRKCSNLLL